MIGSKVIMQNSPDTAFGAESAEVTIGKSIKLSEDEIIEILGNWNLVAAYTLLDIKDFELNATNISQRLNILKSDAENLIETLKNIGLVEYLGPNNFKSVPMFIDDSFMTSSDLLNAFNRFTQNSMLKLTSKDLFSYRFEIMSKKILQKYQSEINNILTKVVEESKSENDCEVYGAGISFTRISRTPRDKARD